MVRDVTDRTLHADDPQQLGEYRLQYKLGEGGMGTVYLAMDLRDRHVAVKVIRPELASDPEFRLRFRDEVLRARDVPPFCTAEVLYADSDHETPYLVVEYVDGPSLADVVHQRGALSNGELHSVAIGVATALAAIHDAVGRRPSGAKPAVPIGRVPPRGLTAFPFHLRDPGPTDRGQQPT
jgi:eukaryotic-like serine/threonine-protein kinase